MSPAIPVIVPEALVLQVVSVIPEPAQLDVVAVAVVSSDFLHEPMSANVPTIKASQNNLFFVLFPLN